MTSDTEQMASKAEIIPGVPPAPRRRNSHWFALFLGFLGIVALITLQLQGKRDRDEARARQAQAMQVPANLTGYALEDARAWRSLLADPGSGNLNDPGSFQKHCGQPGSRVSRPTYFALLYPQHNLVVTFLRRKLGSTKEELGRGGEFLAFQDQAFFWAINPSHVVDRKEALQALGCTVVARS